MQANLDSAMAAGGKAAAVIGGVIDAISARMAVPAKFLWTALIRQVYVKGVYGAIICVLMIALWTTCAITLRKVVRENSQSYDMTATEVIAMVLCGLSFIGLIAFFVYLPDVVQMLNPEYAALDLVLSKIK